LKLKLKPLVLPIEQVKHPSPSVNPANQLLFKLGNIVFFFNKTVSNFILPLNTHLLNPSKNFSKLFCLLGKIIFPLNKLITISISTLL
jgi:hypothetical protein